MNGSTIYHYVKPHHGVLALIYASAKTREKAGAILEDCFAAGEVSEYEFLAIIKHQDRYCVLVRAE